METYILLNQINNTSRLVEVAYTSPISSEAWSNANLLAPNLQGPTYAKTLPVWQRVNLRSYGPTQKAWHLQFHRYTSRYGAILSFVPASWLFGSQFGSQHNFLSFLCFTGVASTRCSRPAKRSCNNALQPVVGSPKAFNRSLSWRALNTNATTTLVRYRIRGGDEYYMGDLNPNPKRIACAVLNLSNGFEEYPCG